MAISEVKDLLYKTFIHFTQVSNTEASIAATQKVADFVLKIRTVVHFKRSDYSLPLTNREICTQGSPLQIQFSEAIRNGDEEFFNRCLQENPEWINLPNPWKSPICTALEAEQDNIAATLYQLGAIDQESFQHFYLACQNGLYRTIATLLKIGIEFPLTQKNLRGYTCLHALTLKKEKEVDQISYKVEIAKKLLKLAPKLIHVLGKNDNTVLHMAAAFGELELVELFLQFNPNLNLKNKFQNTPLFEALTPQGEINILLIEKLASQKSIQLETTNKEGLTAIQVAFKKNLYEVALILLHHGAKISESDHQLLKKWVYQKSSKSTFID